LNNKPDISFQPIIRIDNLTTGYGDLIIHKNINLNINKGEIVAICGGSGCGKSTLLRHMIGLEEPKAGDVLIDNESIVNTTPEEKLRILTKIGILFQSGALFGSLTLAENIKLPINEYTSLPPETVEILVQLKLEMVNLSGFENYLPSEISGGMKKRAGLARAMALDPMILFFDEPSAGLDPVSSADLDNLIIQLNKSLGATIVVVTHELNSIFAIAERVIMLDKETKSIIADGSPEELKRDKLNKKVYNFFNRIPSTIERLNV